MISQRLRQLRRAKRFTLDQLSEISGVNRGTIHRIELGQVSPRIDTLALLCRALGTDFQGFFHPQVLEHGVEEGQEDAAPFDADPLTASGPLDTETLGAVSDFRQGVLDWIEHLEALIHCSADGFAVSDGEGLIIYESQVSILLRGDAARGDRNRPWYLCAHPEDKAALVAGMKAIVRHPEKVLPLEYRVADGKGGWRWVRSTLRNQLGHPAIQGIVINTQDITDWKEAEEQRRHIQMLESQVQVLRDLTGEFSNQWMGVQAHIDLSRLKGVGPEALAGLQASLDRASRLLNQMRDICGHPALDLQPVDLNQLVLAWVDAQRERRDVPPGIDLYLGPSLPRISGDHQVLMRLLDELLTEAGAASGSLADGSCRVSTAHVVLSQEEALHRFKGQDLQPGGAFVVLEACTLKEPLGLFAAWDGNGLSRTDGLARKAFPLYAILRTVRDHRGGVEVEKRGEGEGSTLRLFFPVHEGASHVAPGRKAKPRHRGDVVLVVDDEDLLRATTCALLAQLGYPTLEAQNGREALDLFAKEGHAIGLILLDLNMPVLNGEETFRQIRGVDPSVHVVLCTGATVNASEKGQIHSGLSGILRKPFSFDELRAVVHGVLPR